MLSDDEFGARVIERTPSAPGHLSVLRRIDVVAGMVASGYADGKACERVG